MIQHFWNPKFSAPAIEVQFIKVTWALGGTSFNELDYELKGTAGTKLCGPGSGDSPVSGRWDKSPRSLMYCNDFEANLGCCYPNFVVQRTKLSNNRRKDAATAPRRSQIHLL